MPPVSWPVSVKGVVLHDDRVLLARNDRGEWELPGGRLEAGETPRACVVREVAEETGLAVEAEHLLDVHVFEVLPGRTVLVVAYGCRLLSRPTEVRRSAEHTEVAWVRLDDLTSASLPQGYRTAIAASAGRVMPEREG